MPYTKSPRPYKHEWEMQQKRDENDERAARARARRAVDRTGKDANGNGKADVREGKDIDHIKMLSKGGSSAKSNLRILTPKANRSRNGHSPAEPGGVKPGKKRA